MRVGTVRCWVTKIIKIRTSASFCSSDKITRQDSRPFKHHCLSSQDRIWLFQEDLCLWWRISSHGFGACEDVRCSFDMHTWELQRLIDFVGSESNRMDNEWSYRYWYWLVGEGGWSTSQVRPWWLSRWLQRMMKWIGGKIFWNWSCEKIWVAKRYIQAVKYKVQYMCSTVIT
jgi:hypothetical protein